MKEQPVSPAVISLLNEQAEQTTRRKTRLDKGLEDTFPASDPVSVTNSATATGTTPPESDTGSREQLRTMRRDVENLRHRIGATGAGTSRMARVEATIQRRLRRAVSEKPLATLGLVAAVAFLLGTMRRGTNDR
jgi:ElaB/YqjD/DUF883 family membrane-anchored ribosome-binding protein